MSTYTRAKTKRQRRHPGSRGKSHKLDKQHGDARKETAWLGVDAPSRPSPQRKFPGMEGHEYTYDGGTWHRCTGPEELADFLEKMAELLGWYISATKRKGREVEMKRPVATPVEIFTTTFSPWLSDWVEAELAAGRDPKKKLAAIRNRWLEAAQGLLAGQRHLLGYAFHADTDDLHFDLCCSRQDGKGGRIGEPGLRLVGPWCVSTDRQVRSGAKINADKQRQLRRSIANFRHRYGNTVPLDVALARALDTAAEEVIGPDLIRYREAYAKRVPQMEREHAAAQLAALDAAAQKLRERMAPEPAPTPEPEPEPERGLEREMPEPEPPLPPL